MVRVAFAPMPPAVTAPRIVNVLLFEIAIAPLLVVAESTVNALPVLAIVILPTTGAVGRGPALVNVPIDVDRLITPSAVACKLASTTLVRVPLLPSRIAPPAASVTAPLVPLMVCNETLPVPPPPISTGLALVVSVMPPLVWVKPALPPRFAALASIETGEAVLTLPLIAIAFDAAIVVPPVPSDRLLRLTLPRRACR